MSDSDEEERVETLQVVGGFFFFFFVVLNMGLVDSCSFFSSFRIGVFVPSNLLSFLSASKSCS